MTQRVFDDGMIKQILIQYQKVLIDISNTAVEKDGIRYGVAPKSLIVKYHDNFKIDSDKIGNIIATWRIYSDKILLNMALIPQYLTLTVCGK